MSIALQSGEKRIPTRLDLEFQSRIDQAYLNLVPNGRKNLVIHRLRVVWNWAWEDIAEAVGLSRGHCCRIFAKTRDLLEVIGNEQFSHLPAMISTDAPDDEIDWEPA